MSTIGITPLLALCDNLAKVLNDIQAAYSTNVANGTPNLATITAGLQGNTNSTLARIVGLGDINLHLLLEPPANPAVSSLVGTLAATGAVATYYPFLAPICDGLDRAANGLAGLLATTTSLVHPTFAGLFNYYATNCIALGLRGVSNQAGVIPPGNIFPPTLVDPLGTLTVSGGSSQVFSLGTLVDTTQYGNVPLTLYNGGSGPINGSGSVTVTVLLANGSSTSVTKTLIPPLNVGQAAGVSLGVAGVDVSSITATLATYPYTLKVFAPLVRVVTY